MWTEAFDAKTMDFSPAVPHAPGGLSVTQTNGIATCVPLNRPRGGRAFWGWVRRCLGSEDANCR
jgi:hypothetical protein